MVLPGEGNTLLSESWRLRSYTKLEEHLMNLPGLLVP